MYRIYVPYPAQYDSVLQEEPLLFPHIFQLVPPRRTFENPSSYVASGVTSLKRPIRLRPETGKPHLGFSGDRAGREGGGGDSSIIGGGEPGRWKIRPFVACTTG